MEFKRGRSCEETTSMFIMDSMLADVTLCIQLAS